MVYNLIFRTNPDDQRRFKMLYGWFVAGGNGEQRKGMEVARREATIVDKFWAVSSPTPGVPEGVEGMRQLNLGDWTIELTKQELDLVRKYVEACSPRTELSREFVALVDWLANLPGEA